MSEAASLHWVKLYWDLICITALGEPHASDAFMYAVMFAPAWVIFAAHPYLFFLSVCSTARVATLFFVTFVTRVTAVRECRGMRQVDQPSFLASFPFLSESSPLDAEWDMILHICATVLSNKILHTILQIWSCHYRLRHLWRYFADRSGYYTIFLEWLNIFITVLSFLSLRSRRGRGWWWGGGRWGGNANGINSDYFVNCAVLLPVISPLSDLLFVALGSEDLDWVNFYWILRFKVIVIPVHISTLSYTFSALALWSDVIIIGER